MTIKTGIEKGRFCGYASVFNVTDAHGDVVVPGAFRDSLDQWRRRKKWPKLLWQHDPNRPVGCITHLAEDAHGLYMEAQLLLDLTQGHEAYVMLENGVLEGLSIGFKPLRHRRDPKTGVRYLDTINLYEVSVVTFPANGDAQVHQVKNEGLQDRLDALRLALTLNET